MASATSDARTPSAPTDAKAAPEALIRQAVAAAQHMDFASTQSLLDQAKAIDPKQRYLWSVYGSLAMAYGKTNEAIDDYKKELAEHPESYDVYWQYAVRSRRLMQRDKDAAKRTLRT